MSMNAYEMILKIINKVDEFLQNKLIHNKNKQKIDNQDKHIPDHDSYPQPPTTDDLIKLALYLQKVC